MARQQRLRDERTVALNIPIPYPLRDRLDALQDVLDDANLPGVPVREIVAMLILRAEEDGTKLAQLILDYRNAEPQDAALGGRQDATVIPFKQRRQGRPRSKRRD